MTARQVISECFERGVSLSVDGRSLRAAPADLVSPELASKLRELKGPIMALLIRSLESASPVYYQTGDQVAVEIAPGEIFAGEVVKVTTERVSVRVQTDRGQYTQMGFVPGSPSLRRELRKQLDSPLVEMDTTVLEEMVLLHMDRDVTDEEISGLEELHSAVVYRPSEIELMDEMTTEQIQLAHRVRSIFGGRLDEDEEES